MKKILITAFLLFAGSSFAQTSGFEFKFNGNTAKYDKETNTGTYNGYSSGRFEFNAFMNISDIDTSIWRYVQNTNNAKLSFVENKVEYGGIDSGKIRIPIVDLIDGLSLSDNNTWVGDQTFSDSTTFLGGIWQLGTVNDRPIVYQKYSDGSTPLQSFVGQVGVSEANWGLNLDYRLGVHNYWDSTKPIDYLTINVDGVTWQHIPKGYPNVTSLPDAWAMSGNTTPMLIDTSGFMGIIGGLTSIFRTKTGAIIGTSSANDYTDTTKYNFYGKGGKNYFQNKLGIGTTTPYSKLHLIGDAGSNHGSYNANADLIVDDAGTRALVQLINPTSSYISFGNATTYNLGYLGYTNSTGILNIQAPTAVDIINIRENGVALTSKYAILGNTNTFVNDQIFSGRVRTDTVLNVLGALTINDTVSVTGRLNLAQTTFASNDIVTLSTKGYVVGFNSSGTQGIYLNSTADNTLRIRNAGVSTDANVTLGKLTASNDLIVDDATKGLVLKDTQGTPHYWRITVTTLGVLTVTDLGTTIP